MEQLAKLINDQEMLTKRVSSLERIVSILVKQELSGLTLEEFFNYCRSNNVDPNELSRLLS